MAGGGGANGTGGHHSVLLGGGVENVWMTSLLFAAIVIFTLAWEFATELLEHKVEEHHAYKDLLEKVYKELTLLGAISFGLFIIQDAGVGISGGWLVSFEFAHYLVFFMAIFFVLLSIVAMRGCLNTKRQWDTTAVATIPEICKEYEDRLRWYEHAWLGRALSALGLMHVHLDTSKPQQQMEWFLLRVLFIREYGVDIHFDFAKYARKSLTHAIVKSIEITPTTWGFMLAIVLLFASVDLANKMEIQVPSNRRVLASAGGATPLAPAGAAKHVITISAMSWVAFMVQVVLLVVVRRKHVALLSRKLHMHTWGQALVQELRQQVRLLQNKWKQAERHGHGHLVVQQEESMDADLLREEYEAKAYSPGLARKVRKIAHCVQMWSCFALAYYCLDLVVIVKLTGWTWGKQLSAHVLLLLPHLLLVFLVSPMVIKFESLLSCVVRREDELVAIVEEEHEKLDSLCASVCTKLVDAEIQLEEEAEESGFYLPEHRRSPAHASAGPSVTPEKQRNSGSKNDSTPESPRVTALMGNWDDNHANSDDDDDRMSQLEEDMAMENLQQQEVDHAARAFFNRICFGDEQITLQRLRVGFHKINCYFKNKDWKIICRLIDRNHTSFVTVEQLLAVLQPGLGHWRSHESHLKSSMSLVGDNSEAQLVQRTETSRWLDIGSPRAADEDPIEDEAPSPHDGEDRDFHHYEFVRLARRRSRTHDGHGRVKPRMGSLGRPNTHSFRARMHRANTLHAHVEEKEEEEEEENEEHGQVVSPGRSRKDAVSISVAAGSG